MNKLVFTFLFTITLFVLTAGIFTTDINASFRFVAWADTRGNNPVLTRLSNQVKGMNTQPALTIYPGDLIPTNSSLTVLQRFQNWQTALDGGNNNGMSNKTFASRGNHDLPDTVTWVSFFQFGPLSDPNSVAAKVGVTNYQVLNDDLTYSFDYQNSHFIAVDGTGNANTITAAQIAWMNQDLTAASCRGIKHAFLFWHGPIYTVNGHMSSLPTALVMMLNDQPILTATFHGHEHVLAHTTMDHTRASQLTNLVFEQFVSGGAGAGFYSCTAGRSDFCDTVYGFVVIDVLSDTQIKAGFYKDGQTTPIIPEQTYTKGAVPIPASCGSPAPTSTPGQTFTVAELKSLLTRYLGIQDPRFWPLDGKINMMDAGFVIPKVL